MRPDAGGGRLNPETTSVTWTAEHGLEYAVGDLRPIVDQRNGRLFGLTKHGQVVLLREYEDYRKRCARDAAITFWGHPSGWAPLPERVVRCCCAECDPPQEDLGSAWRITSIGEGCLMARTVSISDHGVEVVGEEHVVYVSPYLVAEPGSREVEIDTFASTVERFGEPYDMATGEVYPPYQLVYRTS